MLREMTGKPNQFVGEHDRARNRDVLRIKSALPYLVLLEHRAPTAPYAAGERRCHIFGQSEDFSGLPDCAAGPVAYDSCRQSCAIVAIALIDVLNDFFSPLVFEIHIDIGRL